MATLPSTTAASTSPQYTYAAATPSYFPAPFPLQQTMVPPPVPYIGAAPTPSVTTVPPPVYPATAPVYSLPQFQQAQQLFQRDAQKITPEALQSVKAALASSEVEHKAETKRKAIPRKAAGQSWEDPTLAEWPESVVRDKRTGKTKGYGFVSFSNPSELVAAMKEMNGKYVGN